LLAVIATQIGTQVVEQATALSKRAPEMLAKWEEPSPSVGSAVNTLKQKIVEKVRTEIGKRTGDVLSELGKAGIRLLSVAGDLIYIVIVPILAFFLLKDGREIRDHILDLVGDGPRRELLDDVLADVHLLLAHYMRALVLLSLSTFVSYSIAFTIIGVPYGILLATTAFLLEFIPMLGPFTAGIIILIVTAVSGAPILTVLIFLVAYRLFQDYVLSPHLMGTGVELHPLLVLFGVFAGAEVAGVAGTFLSVPVLALVRIIYIRIHKARVAAQLTRPAHPRFLAP
jgi:predicted PurR-regulated permease PerM